MSRFVDRSKTSIYKINFRRQTIELTFTTHRAIFSRISMKLTRRKNCLRMKKIFLFFSSRFFFRCFMSFSERESFEFTSRDEHSSRRNQSRWTSEWKSYSSQHKKSNQFKIDQSWKSDRQIYDKRTTRQTAFKVAQRLQIDRSTLKTHSKADFIVKNLKQRWQHFEFFFLSKTIFSVFEKKRSNLMMFRKKKDFHTNNMIKNFKKFFENCLKKENKWMNNKKCLIKNEKKKQSFKSRIIQRFIFILFTIYFRIHQSLFTTFFIHEKRSFSMNFKKNFTKNSISILNRSKWSISRLIMRKQACFAWKTQDFSHEKRYSQSWMTNRHLHDVFSSRTRSCKNRFIANDWISWHKNQKMKRRIHFEEEFNEKMFFIFNEFIV
jgi:hypothetical protein